jgi:uncharacterized protein
MEFEWWEAKRLAVLQERGIDFIDAPALFDGRSLYTVPSPRGAEERWVSIGELNGDCSLPCGRGGTPSSELLL